MRFGRLDNWFRFPAYALFAVCCGLVSLCCAQESEFYAAYRANWEKARQAHDTKDYRSALRHYAKVAELLPSEPTTRFYLACCHARLGDKDKAVAALEAAVRFGWEDAQWMEQAEDLQSLHGDPRFAQAVKAATECGKETLLLYVGQAVDPAKPAPLVVLLHGLGCGPRSELPYWKPVADRLGLIVVAPRGTTKVAPMLYGWHRQGAKDSAALDYFDLAATKQLMDAAIALAGEKYAIDRSRVLLAGFSQGGGVALRLLGEHPERFCGAVAVCSLCQPPGVPFWQAAVRKRPVKVCIISGKLDRLFSRSQQAAEQLRAAKVPLRYEELERTGHEYPPDQVDRLTQAIQFVLKQPTTEQGG